ncbi:MAG TPA: hypothetical protein VE912_23440 [Bacteroidales bacterium]|nr:hypothetical protein [Bacteroidales bacterium]
MNRRIKYSAWSESASYYIRDFSYKNGDYIYKWMKLNGIGESSYGKYLDALGRKPDVFYHRLYGHHLIYDFPIQNPENIPDFLEHVLISDFFTKQGLPIIPGDIIEIPEVKSLFHKVSLKWNFINGFDLLTGTLAVYNNYKISSDYFKQEASIEKIDELAKILGISGIHIALALSTFNPLFIISAVISGAGALVGLLNNPYKIYFRQVAQKYAVFLSVNSYNIDSVIEQYDINAVVKSYDINNRDYI